MENLMKTKSSFLTQYPLRIIALVACWSSLAFAEDGKPATKPSREVATEMRTYDLSELLRPIPNYELAEPDPQTQSNRGGGGGGGALFGNAGDQARAQNDAKAKQ